MKVKVLGSGCRTCDDLEKCVQKAIKELQLDVSLQRITDYKTIVKYGVLNTPALIINESIIIRGRVPTKKEMIQILKKHLLIKDNFN